MAQAQHGRFVPFPTGNLNLLIAGFSGVAVNSIGSESRVWDKEHSFRAHEAASQRQPAPESSPFPRGQNQQGEFCSFPPPCPVLKTKGISLRNNG